MVGMHIIPHILYGVVNHLMLVLFAQSIVGFERIRVQRGHRLYVSHGPKPEAVSFPDDPRQ